MARTVASLPAGSRLTDFISLGVLARTFPKATLDGVLEATKKSSIRHRDLPAHVVIYYVIALALYMRTSYREVLRCLLEGIQWLRDPSAELKVSGKSGISQARTRLGWEPLKQLHDQLIQPIAVQDTKGAWYRGWRIVSLDGSTLDVADEQVNDRAFGRPGASTGTSAYPQIRFVSLVENGTHVLFGSQMGSYATSEAKLAQEVIRNLCKGMLCLADRYFFNYALWTQAQQTGADLLWRVKITAGLECEKRLPDGSYLSRIYPREDRPHGRGKGRRQSAQGVVVRVIDYKLSGVTEVEDGYRLVTTILDPEVAPAKESAALYHERWEIETALDELKTHLRGSRIVLRSKTPNLVQQEFYGFLLAHFAIRKLMHEAALQADEDPDRLSFIHSVHVVRRKITTYNALPPSAPEEFP
jgi:hypothetical protein